MILIPILLIGLWLVFDRAKEIFGKTIIVILVTFSLHLGFLFLNGVGNVEHFISDESGYLLGLSSVHSHSMDRYFWFLFNDIVRYPFEFYDYFNKLINLSMIPFFVLGIYRLFKNDQRVFHFFIFFPYVLYLAQVNLRDFLIFTICIWLFALLEDYKRFVLQITLLVLMMIFLRPFYVFFFFISVAGFVLLKTLSGANKLRNLIITGCIIGVIISLIYFVFHSKINRYIAWANFILENGNSTYTSSFSVASIFSSIITYVLAPLPGSLLFYFLEDGASEWGAVHDIVRFVTQSFLYLLMIFVIVQFTKSLKSIRSRLVKIPQSVIMFNFFNVTSLIVYAIYYGGAGHSRLKAPTYFLIFSLYLFFNKSSKLMSK